jgi:hypothetical protein
MTCKNSRQMIKYIHCIIIIIIIISIHIVPRQLSTLLNHSFVDGGKGEIHTIFIVAPYTVAAKVIT